MENVITIKSVIWEGKKWGFPGKRCVGIAERDLEKNGETFMHVEVMDVNAKKERYFPNKFRIPKERIFAYPSFKRKGTMLRIVPLDHMQEVFPVATE